MDQHYLLIPFTLSQCNFSQHSVSGYGGCIYVTGLSHQFGTEFRHSQETNQEIDNQFILKKD